MCLSFLCVYNEESGQISSCAVKNCSASVKSGNSSTRAYAGGLIVDNHGKFLDCTIEEGNIFLQLSSTGGPGGPFSYLSGIVRWNNGYMQNCSASGVTLDSICFGRHHEHESTGGICQLNEGVIRNCSFSGSAINTGIGTNNGSVS